MFKSENKLTDIFSPYSNEVFITYMVSSLIRYIAFKLVFYKNGQLLVPLLMITFGYGHPFVLYSAVVRSLDSVFKNKADVVFNMLE